MATGYRAEHLPGSVVILIFVKELAMKFKLGQILALAIALVFSAFLIYEAPFQAAAAESASSQVVFAPVNDPPVIGTARGKLDYPLLLLELGFVVFVGGAIFLASGRKKD